jgi:Holliday junction resolvase RusA-like endonuclease
MRYKIWIKEMRERLQDMPIPEGSLHVDLLFIVKRPKAMRTPHERVLHSKRPDLDNMVKAVLDALPIEDDARIVSLSARKYYAAAGEDPQIELHVMSCDEKKSLR